MKKYTIIGYWPDSMRRFADFCSAVNPYEAEMSVLRKHDGLAICGVVEGYRSCVDACELVRTSDTE